MGRHIINALVYVEVDADSPEAAYEHFADGLDEITGLRTLTVQQVEQSVKPFDLPPGAERWREVAADIRFGDDRWESVGQRAWGSYDGSWWWTDGHVCLRCDEPTPADEAVWRRIPDSAFEKAFAAKKRRKRTVAWSAPRQVHHTAAASYAITDTEPRVFLDAKYIRLGEQGSVRQWRIAGAVDPVHGLDADGRLLMIVAPMKVDAKDWEVAKRLSSPSEGDPK